MECSLVGKYYEGEATLAYLSADYDQMVPQQKISRQKQKGITRASPASDADVHIEISGQKFRNLHHYTNYRRYRVSVKIGGP